MRGISGHSFLLHEPVRWGKDPLLILNHLGYESAGRTFSPSTLIHVILSPHAGNPALFPHPKTTPMDLVSGMGRRFNRGCWVLKVRVMYKKRDRCQLLTRRRLNSRPETRALTMGLNNPVHCFSPPGNLILLPARIRPTRHQRDLLFLTIDSPYFDSFESTRARERPQGPLVSQSPSAYQHNQLQTNRMSQTARWD